MSWSDFHNRRDAIKAVLRHAEEQPSAALPFVELPEVTAVFATPVDLLMALQYDWSQALWSQIELLGLDTGGVLLDARTVCRQAWQQATEANPTLRRLLDEHLAEVPNRDGEQSYLVSAGIGHAAQTGKRHDLIA